jgi:hypothetical protein
MKKFLIIVLMLVSVQVVAQKEKYQSVFVYQFAKYFNWPASMQQGNFVIGVIGNSEMFKFIEEMAVAKKLASQNIEIKTFKNVSEIGQCHILVMSGSMNNSISEVVKSINGKNILLVGEGDGLASKGAHISFIENGGKLTFEINQTKINQMSLQVNSQLFALASKNY